MQTRILGRTGLEVPVLAFGASSLGQEFRPVTLDEAFGSHQDPLAPRPGQAVDEAYAPLRERILAALPAPWGWGPALA